MTSLPFATDLAAPEFPGTERDLSGPRWSTMTRHGCAHAGALAGLGATPLPLDETAQDYADRGQIVGWYVAARTAIDLAREAEVIVEPTYAWGDPTDLFAEACGKLHGDLLVTWPGLPRRRAAVECKSSTRLQVMDAHRLQVAGCAVADPTITEAWVLVIDPNTSRTIWEQIDLAEWKPRAANLMRHAARAIAAKDLGECPPPSWAHERAPGCYGCPFSYAESGCQRPAEPPAPFVESHAEQAIAFLDALRVRDKAKRDLKDAEAVFTEARDGIAPVIAKGERKQIGRVLVTWKGNGQMDARSVEEGA